LNPEQHTTMTTYQLIRATIEALSDWQADLESGPFSSNTDACASTLRHVCAANSALLALRESEFEQPSEDAFEIEDSEPNYGPSLDDAYPDPWADDYGAIVRGEL
jgi:hypothetical protein